MENPYQLIFHVEPTTGLLNDPNGLAQFNGTYYFFHQWNRFETNHCYKEWGLFTSQDMIHWEGHGSAILPDRTIDQNGVYSGSGILHNGKIYLFYTGNVKNNGMRKSYQCLTISEDGKTFVKQEPAIVTPPVFTEHHRDPKVWRGKNHWWMIVGTQTKAEVGTIALYASDDLVHWRYENKLCDDTFDQMCECPDLFPVNDDTDILVCCPQKRPTKGNQETAISSYAAYIPGKFDEDTQKFVGKSNPIRLDDGFDFYAPQTFQDELGRRIMVAWMSRMSEAEEQQCPTQQFGYVHCLTLPRVVKWQDGQLLQQPIDEVKQLRKTRTEFTASDKTFDLVSGRFEIVLTRQRFNRDFQLSMRNDAVSLQYNHKAKMLVVSRINWVSKKCETKVITLEQLSNLRIISDSSTMEIFVNDGASVFSLRYFTDADQLTAQYHSLATDDKLTYFSY